MLAYIDRSDQLVITWSSEAWFVEDEIAAREWHLFFSLWFGTSAEVAYVC